MIQTSTWEATTTDGRHVRVERDAEHVYFSGSSTPIPLDLSPDYRVYIDGEPIDPAGLAYRHEGDRVIVLTTSIGELRIAG